MEAINGLRRPCHIPSDFLLERSGIGRVELDSQTHGERRLSYKRKHWWGEGQEPCDFIRTDQTENSRTKMNLHHCLTLWLATSREQSCRLYQSCIRAALFLNINMKQGWLKRKSRSHALHANTLLKFLTLSKQVLGLWNICSDCTFWFLLRPSNVCRNKSAQRFCPVALPVPLVQQRAKTTHLTATAMSVLCQSWGPERWV